MKSLTAFTATPLTEKFSVAAKLSKTSVQVLSVEFKILGPVDLISWPTSKKVVTRENELWKTTCLETFFSAGTTQEDPYVEINCSPNGNWNAYRFLRYREGMTPSAEISVLLKQKKIHADEAYFLIEIQSTNTLNIQSCGLTMVMEFTNGKKSYWALRHPGSTADFHSKEGWDHSAQCIEN